MRKHRAYSALLSDNLSLNLEELLLLDNYSHTLRTLLGWFSDSEIDAYQSEESFHTIFEKVLIEVFSTSWEEEVHLDSMTLSEPF